MLPSKIETKQPLRPLWSYGGQPRTNQKVAPRVMNGARTRDLDLGKVALYQLSYHHIELRAARGD